MSLTNERIKQQENEMSGRLRSTYGEALKPALEGFLNDPRTRTYLRLPEAEDAVIFDDIYAHKEISHLANLFCALADPAPPYGEEGLVVFLSFVKQQAQTIEDGPSVDPMIEAAQAHAAKLKVERARHLN